MKINKYIKLWEARGYPNGIPDEAPALLEMYCKAPSYRAICRAILKNDIQLESLGFTREKCDIYTILKKIELKAKGKKVDRLIIQYSLFRELNYECI
ncbi:MAG: hypothetical protein PHX80_03990 [Candidatus Nanoarchaeia archaeon]|nr:hypothetical protein [Candidatus Nanoarchaeia archaeon]